MGREATRAVSRGRLPVFPESQLWLQCLSEFRKFFFFFLFFKILDSPWLFTGITQEFTRKTSQSLVMQESVRLLAR